MDVSPVKGVIGAVVKGVRLDTPPQQALVDRIDSALECYGVLVFPDQQLTPAQQAGFTRAFGPLGRSPRVDGRIPGEPDVFAVGNVDGRAILFSPGEPDGELEWHTDQIHRPAPARASLLYARIVPPEGGDTLFACMYSAYDALSDEDRALCDSLTAIHSPSGLRSYLGTEGQSGDSDALYETADATVRWPLVRRHPVNGRKALYFGSHVTVGIEGWSARQAAELIERLSLHATRKHFRYRHRWNVGEAVLWDNRRVLHAGTWYDTLRYQRLMHRTMLVETEKIV